MSSAFLRYNIRFDSVLVTLSPEILAIFVSVLGGVCLALFFILTPPFSIGLVILHEYGHYNYLKKLSNKLDLTCGIVDFGISKNKCILYKGKTFNCTLNQVNPKNLIHQEYIVEAAKAGCKFYCFSIIKFSIIMSIIFGLFVTPLCIITWLTFAFSMCGLELSNYHFSKSHFSDKAIARHPENFKYIDEDYKEYEYHICIISKSMLQL